MPAAGSVRVAVVGAGFGGLEVARALGRDRAFDVELIDCRNHHLFQPLLYQVATAALEPADIAYAVRGIVRRLDRTRFTAAEVVGGDLDRRLLTTAEGHEIGYDALVLAAGTRTASFGVRGVAEHAFGLKSLADALSFREHLLRCCERAATEVSSRRSGTVDPALLSVVVVGGGATGVEMAGALSELFRHVLRRDFPELDLTRAGVTLVEMGQRLLPPYHAALQAHAAGELRRRGVTLRLGATVSEVRSDAVQLADGSVLPAATTLWAAGVEAVPLGAALGLATDRSGRITVGDDLAVPGRPEVFVIGDLAGVAGPDGTPLPQVAQVAIQQGRHVAATIAARAAGTPGPPPFRYRDKGTMATIGRRAAVAEVPLGLILGGVATLGHGPARGLSFDRRLRFRGTVGWLLWLGLHLVTLIGFRNRLSVLLSWSWNYLTWDRAARLITGLRFVPQAGERQTRG